MGLFSGLGSHTTTGSIGVAAIPGVGGTLAFQNFQTDQANTELHCLLTINGNLSKRTIALGPLPQAQGSFDISFPDGTDLSLFNVVVIRAGEDTVGMAPIP